MVATSITARMTNDSAAPNGQFLPEVNWVTM